MWIYERIVLHCVHLKLNLSTLAAFIYSHICQPQKKHVYFLFAYLLVFELCIWEVAADMACGKQSAVGVEARGRMEE